MYSGRLASVINHLHGMQLLPRQRCFHSRCPLMLPMPCRSSSNQAEHASVAVQLVVHQQLARRARPDRHLHRRIFPVYAAAPSRAQVSPLLSDLDQNLTVQMVVEQQLAREGTSRQEVGREAFTERVWAWRRQCARTSCPVMLAMRPRSCGPAVPACIMATACIHMRRV